MAANSSKNSAISWTSRCSAAPGAEARTVASAVPSVSNLSTLAGLARTSGSKVLLPPKRLLPEVGIAEPGRYHYLPVIGWLYRRRLQLASDLLGEGPFDSTLEIGYGSGLF